FLALHCQALALHLSGLVALMRRSRRSKRLLPRTCLRPRPIVALQLPWLIWGAGQRRARQWPACSNSSPAFAVLHGRSACGCPRSLAWDFGRLGFRSEGHGGAASPPRPAPRAPSAPRPARRIAAPAERRSALPAHLRRQRLQRGDAVFRRRVRREQIVHAL